MRIVMATIGSRGDVEPPLAVASALRERGHEIEFIGPPAYREQVEPCGLAYHSLHPAPREIGTSSGERQPLLRRVLAWRDKIRSTNRHVVQQFERVLEVAESADVLVTSVTLTPAALTAKDRFDIPVALYYFVPPFVPTAEFPCPWLPALGTSRLANRLSHAVFERLLWLPAKSFVNRWRQEAHGLAPFAWPGPFRRVYSERVPLFLGISRHLYPAASDWPSSVHVTGRWMLPLENSYRPSAELERFLDLDPRPICVTFGDNPLAERKRILDLLRAALAADDRRAVVVSAVSGLGGGEDLGPSMMRVDQIPYGWLFPRTSAVIHHGGAGAAAYCIGAGVPSITIGTRPDQQVFGRRLFEIGVAPRPMRLRSLTERGLVEALRATRNPTMVRAASELGERVRTEDGVAAAVTRIEALSGS